MLVSGDASELEDLVHILRKSGIKSVGMDGIGSRCSVCNGSLKERRLDRVKKNDDNNVEDVVPERVIAYHNQFFQWYRLRQNIYWEGSHLKRITDLVRKLDAELIGRTCTTTTTTSC